MMVPDSFVKDFGYYLKVERQLSGNTVSSYLSDVSDFIATSGAAPLSCTSEDIRGYLQKRSSEISKRSQARAVSALKSFFDWLIAEKERDDNPCDRIEAPKLGRYIPEVLSVEEVEAIIGSVRTDRWNGVRDKAMLEVMYGCGLRVSETCGLLFSNIFEERSFICVTGKGDKERLVPMGDSVMEALEQWKACRPEPAGTEFSDVVFLNRFGKSVSRVSAFNMVKRQCILAGVNKEISPHTFRHSFATHMIENGADLRAVQEMLGHESITTTEIYTHIDKGIWQKAVLEHHPRK